MCNYGTFLFWLPPLQARNFPGTIFAFRRYQKDAVVGDILRRLFESLLWWDQKDCISMLFRSDTKDSWRLSSSVHRKAHIVVIWWNQLSALELWSCPQLLFVLCVGSWSQGRSLVRMFIKSHLSLRPCSVPSVDWTVAECLLVSGLRNCLKKDLPKNTFPFSKPSHSRLIVPKAFPCCMKVEWSQVFSLGAWDGSIEYNTCCNLVLQWVSRSYTFLRVPRKIPLFLFVS